MKIKVFSHLEQWFDEKRMLHRKNGKIVAERDDIESATRYAVMMLRYALCEADSESYFQEYADNTDYDPFDILENS